jgi:hypothetical protein
MPRRLIKSTRKHRENLARCATELDLPAEDLAAIGAEADWSTAGWVGSRNRWTRLGRCLW